MHAAQRSHPFTKVQGQDVLHMYTASEYVNPIDVKPFLESDENLQRRSLC